MECSTCNDTGKYTVSKFSSGVISLHCDCQEGQQLYHADFCLKRDACPSLKGIITCPCECHEDKVKMAWEEFCEEHEVEVEFVAPVLRGAIMSNPSLRELALQCHRKNREVSTSKEQTTEATE